MKLLAAALHGPEWWRRPRRGGSSSVTYSEALRRCSTLLLRADGDMAGDGSSCCPPGPLTPQQVQSYEELGFVLVDTPFDEAWLDAAAETWRQVTSGQVVNTATDRGYVTAISHPFFEDVARQMLRSDSVVTIEHGMHNRPPAAPEVHHQGAAPIPAAAVAEHDAQAEWDRGCHIDWQTTESDFHATPRRDLLALWLWLNDVPAERAAMRVLPRSHLAVMRHFERTLQPQRRQWTPRHHPLFPLPPSRYPTYPEYLPAPQGFAYTGPEAAVIPVVARRGQLQVFTQAMLHNGARNFTQEPRMGMIVSYIASDVLFGPSLGGIYARQKDTYRTLRRGLRSWAPGREHIVPSADEAHQWPTAPSHTHNGAWAASGLCDKWWPELFLPGHSLASTCKYWQEEVQEVSLHNRGHHAKM